MASVLRHSHLNVCTDSLRFDLVVDKGTLDIMLTTEDGWQRSVRAFKWLYGRMRTPATMLLVSHSPPDERIDLINSVYWHSVEFKVVKATAVEELQAGTKPYKEELMDYPYAVAAWEQQKIVRRAAAAEAEAAAAAAEAKHDGGCTSKSEHRAPTLTGDAGGTADEADTSPPLPEGCMNFSPGTAFVYILEK